MLTIKTMSFTTVNDADLVSQSLSGNRDAFGQIVERYQSLICSLAYSATGSLSQSEDLAQETFLAAWKQLRDLREPQKLRSWLCGIARNLTNGALRRQGREPVESSETLEEVSQSQSPEPWPVDQAIKKEEAEILWRSLERIPPAYREPLILFYRQHQSADKVAQALDLTEEAVHQRLSRGRKLLQEQVLAFVEGTLGRTNPGKAFTIGVLTSLPALSFSAKAASLGATAAKTGGVAKSVGLAGFLAAYLSPLLVVLPNYLGYRLAIAEADSDNERHHIRAFYRKATLIILSLYIPYVIIVLSFTLHRNRPALLANLLIAGLVGIFVPTLFITGMISGRQRRQYFSRKLEHDYAGEFPKPAFEYRTHTTFLGLPLIHIRVGDQFAFMREPVRAWIAMGGRAIGGLFAFGAWSMAPISLGGFSIGLLSFGGASLGLFSVGGIAVGAYTFFGGLCFAWQAQGACAIAWHAAFGGVAIARDFAIGGIAHAAETNNDAAWQFVQSDPFFRVSHFVNTHWIWLNLLWAIPFFVQWRAIRRRRRQNLARA